MSSTSTSSVQVAIRVRPFLSAEAGNARCVEIIHNGGIRIGGEQGAQFTFDFCLGVSGNNNNNNTQQYVYQTCIEPMTMSCLAGYNATIFAYGQTGSGKTFTVLGGSSQEAEGILPRALRDLFARLECARDKGSSNHTNDSEESEKMGDDDDSPQRFQFEVRLQFLELYGEEVRDLLSPAHNLTKLSIRDYGNGGEPEVVGASEVVVSSPEEALLLLERGSFRRYDFFILFSLFFENDCLMSNYIYCGSFFSNGTTILLSTTCIFSFILHLYMNTHVVLL